MYDFDALFRAQYEKYPMLTVQDLVKALYQSVYGCGHFVGEGGRKYMAEELASLDAARDNGFIEPIGENYCRVHLTGMLKNGISPDTLFGLFALSSREPQGDPEIFQAGLARLEKLIENGDIPLDRAESAGFIAAYRAAGCPATHHSEKFRDAYSPAYRVVSAKMCRYMEIFAAIDRKMSEKDMVSVAIEGGSASGKTSLAALLEKVYDCNVFHMDDFFLQPHQRTPERFAQPGGNVDHERFSVEIAEKLCEKTAFMYRKFDCSTMSLGEKIYVTPKKLNVTEGAYSMHPQLRGNWDISVFLDSDTEVQKARILRRNGEDMLQRFVNEWIPLENVYFEKTGAREACDIVIPAGN